jgi:2-aminoethylphosphonate-pyruvate transaminase
MLLLTPGPVSTRPEVKAAMTRDWGPWDSAFKAVYAGLRQKMLRVAQAPADTHTAIALQGSGHFAIEAAIRALMPVEASRLLVPLTGSYARRLARLARDAGRAVVTLDMAQEQPIDPDLVARALRDDPAITHVGLVYSETSSGVVHDPVAMGEVVRAAGRHLLLDAVSAFGALPLALGARPEIQAMVFTANKCLEGMPGLSVVVARNEALDRARPAGSWSLDLADAYRHAHTHGPGAFRFTPPAQVVAALDVALDLHEAEGGQPARLARYAENASTLYRGMQEIGLSPYLPESVQGPIVLNVRAPSDPEWSLLAFVEHLKRHGFLISNFFDTPEPSFRVGCIGQVYPDDMRQFCRAVDAVLNDLSLRRRSPDRRAA